MEFGNLFDERSKNAVDLIMDENPFKLMVLNIKAFSTTVVYSQP
tara:strand:+ start:49 stop:180 length:132 start_codon:yes stop_codon:yes gene_type:complete